MLAIVSAMTFGFAPAFAQNASLRVTVPSPAPGATFPTLQYQMTRPDDDNYALGGLRIIYDPAFFRALSMPTEAPTSTGRIGLAGWTTPNAPLGGSAAGFREVNGWLGFGLAVSWGGPPPRKPSTWRREPKDAPSLEAVR